MIAAIDPGLRRRLATLDVPGRAFDHPDPVRRCPALARWYAEFVANHPGWGHLAPLVGLAAWIADQPFAALVFPSTSLDSFGSRLSPAFPPDPPTIWCRMQPAGLVDCRFSSPDDPVRYVVPLDATRDLYAALVNRLAISAR